VAETAPLLSVTSPRPVFDAGLAVLTKATSPDGVPPLPATPTLTLTGVPCVKVVELRLKVVVVGLNVSEFQSLTRRLASTLPRPVARS
jgi:hypothetical protein